MEFTENLHDEMRTSSIKESSENSQNEKTDQGFTERLEKEYNKTKKEALKAFRKTSKWVEENPKQTVLIVGALVVAARPRFFFKLARVAVSTKAVDMLKNSLTDTVKAAVRKSKDDDESTNTPDQSEVH